MIACAPPIEQGTASPVLTRTRTTPLVESDSLFLGRPLGFAVGVDSLRFVATDLDAGRVLAWDDTGRAVASFGRVGRGPGEFLGSAAVSLQRDLLWVSENGSISWKGVRRNDAREVPMPSEFARLKDVGIGRLAEVLPAVSGPSRVVGFGPLDGVYVLDDRPAVPVRGDTLFVLRQEVDETRIATFIEQYVVNAAARQWTALVTGPMLPSRDG